jgi:hypothetical protein
VPDQAEEDPFRDLPDGLVVVDAGERVRVCNPAAAELLGRPVEQIVGRGASEVLTFTDEAGRTWWSCTAPLRRLARVRGTPERLLRLPGGSGLFVTSRFVRAGRDTPDAGRVVRTLVSLRPARAQAAAERGAAELVATVAHELRSPLTSVKGFTATLLAKWERFTDEQRLVMLQTVNADADRVTRLLAELLDVSRIDTGRLELHRQVVDLPGALDRTIAGRVASGDDPDRFRVVLTGDLPEMWLDPDKIDQVLGNLVENAVRHGSGRVTVRIEGDPDGAVLRVADEGQGVPGELRERVFTKFFRGKARHGGTGLGLYIVRGLVQAHGGGVGIADEPAGGACFVVRLPRGVAPFSAAFDPPSPTG